MSDETADGKRKRDDTEPEVESAEEPAAKVSKPALQHSSEANTEADQVPPSASEASTENKGTAESKPDTAPVTTGLSGGEHPSKVETTIDTPSQASVEGAPAPPPSAAPVPTPQQVSAPSATVSAPAPTATSTAPLVYQQPPHGNAMPNSGVEDPSAMVEERGEVSALYVGRVIGKGGEMIRDLQARSGCRMDVDQNVPPGQPRFITYRGTRSTVDFAKRLVSMLCAENVNVDDLPLGNAKREYLVIPAQSVGKIIGQRGSMIRELQSRSHAKIQVDHNDNGGYLPPNQKRLTVIGTEQAVTKATEMINFLVANPLMDAMQSLNMLVEDKLHRGGVWGSGPPYLNMPNHGHNMQPPSNPYGGGYDMGQYQGHQSHQQPPAYGGGQAYQQAPVAHYNPPQQQGMPPHASGGGGYGGYGGTEMEIFPAARNFMGRIIGQKGVTINDLQRRSGCNIQINQDVPPGQDCEISIRGTRQGIDMAKQMLQDIIEIGPNHPYAGGGGATQQVGYGNSYAQDPYNQQMAPQQQQPQHYAGGYQQQPAYGQTPYQAPYADQSAASGPGMYAAAQPAYTMQQQQQQPTSYYAAPQQPPVAAPVAMQQPMVSDWKSAAAENGQVYYYNERTGETQWEKPIGMP